MVTRWTYIDWGEKIRNHREELDRAEKERENRLERSKKQEKSWELFRLCSKFLRENCEGWENQREMRDMEMQQEEKKQLRLSKATRLKVTLNTKLVQKKITDCLQKLSEKDRNRIMEDENGRRLCEMKEVKENLWKRWRSENEKETEVKPEAEILKEMEDKLEKIEKMVEIQKIEEGEKNKRLEVKKKMEEKWALMRWITEYIEENTRSWEDDRKIRKQEEMMKIEEWERKSRHQKIKLLREREKEKKNQGEKTPKTK